MRRTFLQQLSWALFDFANSAFPTVIITFVFAAYFSRGIAPDEVSGTSLWGYASSAAAICIAVSAPILGAIADQTGARKPWIFGFSFLCVSASALLWFASPDESSIVFALVCVGVATFGFEMAMVFYNAMLAGISLKGHEGRLSGYAWGLGYIGGLICLGLVLVFFVQTEHPLFGLNKDLAEHVRISGPFVALWYTLFALPLFFFVPDQPVKTTISSAIHQGMSTLKTSLMSWRDNRTVFQFLLARMIYTDGLNTIFAFGGIYAAGTFAMGFSEIIIFGIGINVTAGLGAVVFGLLDDRWGPKRVIVISVLGLMLIVLALLFVTDKSHFLILGITLGIFVGPAQAASRTYMTHATPEKIRNELFGLYALSGKATAFLGPLMVAIFSDLFASQRIGMASILIFLLIGLVLMRNLPDIRGQKSD